MHTRSVTVDEMYGDPGLTDDAIAALLQRSLQPRPATMLYDKIGALGLTSHHHLLDLGCRDAAHTCVLVKRYGCRALGVDPVAYNLVLAEKLIAEQGLSGQLRVAHGHAAAIPAADGTFDYIWCRDVLAHVPDLPAALRDCFRVLQPGGAMLIYLTLATELLEPNEAARLYGPLAMVPSNMEAANVEAAALAAGFTIVEHDRIDSEWREWWEENGDPRTSTQLLALARLRRDRDRLRAELGEVNYAVELANCQWGVYQMLGKLCPQIYVLRKN